MNSKNPFLPKLTGANAALSIQHLFAMFGATILVPILTGLDISTALLTAGIGTLIFHLCAKKKVPVFLGSSFAFIPGIATIVATMGPQYAQGGIIAAGVIYLILAIVIFGVGVERIKKLFPPIVTGPVIVCIGLGLSYSAINNAGFLKMSAPMTEGGVDWIIAVFVMVVVVILTIRARGFFKLVPILLGIGAGYVLCLILNACGVITMNFTSVVEAPWFNVPFVSENFCSLPLFDWGAIILIAPLAFVTFMEHIGDITANSAVVGKDFTKDPGLHRTLLGDGLATIAAGFLGGPANTTYSENTGVLATTRNYNPGLLRWTAIFAIILAFVGKFGGFLESIPNPVIGGVSIVLYGMIAAVGVRTMISAKVDFNQSRNLLIFAVVSVIGIGVTIATYVPENLSVAGISLGGNFSLSGLFIAMIAGVVLNLILPKEDKNNEVEDKNE